MGFFDRINDEHAERLLGSAGLAGEGEAGLEETAAFVRALPAAVPAQPDAAPAAAMIRTLAETARSASLEASREATVPMQTVPVGRGGGWRLRLALLGAAVAPLPLLTAGLAYAGVSLPDPVQEAFEAVGLELPNQSDSGDAPAGGSERDDDRGSLGSAPGVDGGAGAEDGDGDEAAAGKPADGDGKSHTQGHHKPGQGNGQGHGKGDGNGKPHGPAGGAPPGQGGVPPGNGGVPPGGGSGGSTGPPPSAGPPAQGGVPPGQAKPK